MRNNKKFTILFLIQRFPRYERKKQIEKVASLLNVSNSTLERIMYARVNSTHTMTAESVFILATHFNIKPVDIFTKEYKKYLHSIKFE